MRTLLNSITYVWLKLSCLIADPDKRKGAAFINKILISSPRLSTLVFLYKEIVIEHCYRVEGINKNPIIVDCGANIGVATVYFATEYKNAKVYAFEPNPEAFAYLKKNISSLHTVNIKIFQNALGISDKVEHLYMSESIASLRASLRNDRSKWTRHISIRVKRLSKLFNKLPVIHLVKMDIEGAEFDVISELYECGVLGKPYHYIIEYHNVPTSQSNIGAFLLLLENVGYHITLKGGNVDGTGYQDILIHASKSFLKK